jgi:hypothetical protein
MGRVELQPAVFVRVATKGLTGYGTWKSAQGYDFNRLVFRTFPGKIAGRVIENSDPLPPIVFVRM